MPLPMFPVGAEAGFPSTGAGALSAAALLSLTALSPAQLVGTDICFGFLLSLVGSREHLLEHANYPHLLISLIVGRGAGVLVGTFAARYFLQRPLCFVFWIWLWGLACQFIYTNLFTR